ncbi:ATP-binding SpoIIE family protein phosphatase [Burkholderia plantarii]|uniref:Anti-sigma regulatory factor,serine/threonine protein kinase and phosphatase n=1 Tax=Burkholderia plantarii TaxID=41899 RepID=A0A0B6RUV9_BURPL|nr:ATP-binding SpoIIE family protein phosphatase [Burkholderia plantarii]AJK45939.1 anti-sigma regulatory factor,serine/threonine protein kinase and phosphatase [Burkholderia plantarii]ALK30193.1 Anti-sigma regulatory factor, serine/threonine protein kinase and phosphatase [Burkholderia plantarii]GLZ18296.1 TorS-related protein [Burkholderia plantarii]
MENSLSGLRAAHASFEISDPSGVAFARRGANEIARRCLPGETDLGRVALIVTEAATNILKHAKHGELLVRELPTRGPPSGLSPAGGGVELIALDNGPGILDVRAAFEDGYSNTGTPGTGLGAMRRLSDELAVYSQPGLGTVVRAVVHARGVGSGGAVAAEVPDLDIGGVCVPYPGETVSGDAWGIEVDGAGLVVTVADGLGHGPDAHVAATCAIDIAHRNPGFAPRRLMHAMHDALHATRGAAVAITRLDPARTGLSFSSVGNVAASLWGGGRPLAMPWPVGRPTPDDAGSRGERESWQLASRNGIVGHAMRDAQEIAARWQDGTMLILHSDGIGTRWDLAAYPGLRLQPAAVIAAVLYRDFSRRRDDATVVVVKAAQSR